MSQPAATRRRVFWNDARFFIGITLVAVAVAGVWLVVTAARQSEPVLVAARTLVPGEVLGDDDVRTADVALGLTGQRYLEPDALVTGGVVTRTVHEGELLPVDAIGAVDAAHRTNVVIRTAAGVPAGVERGSTVELWSAAPSEAGGFDVPAVLVADATVAGVVEGGGMVATDAVEIELVIPRADVARTLEAVAADAALSVVPAGPGR